MVRIQTSPNGPKPVLLCDMCGRRIADSSNGMVFYDEDAEVHPVHKGECRVAAEARYGNEAGHELIAYFNDLRRDSGTSFKDLMLREAADRGLPLDQYNRLVEQLNETCAVLDRAPV